MTQQITLTYRTSTDNSWRTETFDSERLLCTRVAELAEPGQEEFKINGVWMAAEDFAERLKLIEARREAVAYLLLVLDKGPEWKRLWPTEAEQRAYWSEMLFPDEREEFRDRADALIAAYEAALP